MKSHATVAVAGGEGAGASVPYHPTEVGRLRVMLIERIGGKSCALLTGGAVLAGTRERLDRLKMAGLGRFADLRQARIGRSLALGDIDTGVQNEAEGLEIGSLGGRRAAQPLRGAPHGPSGAGRCARAGAGRCD
jgi:hypothetical protein